MKDALILYGATGYTGGLVLRQAVAQGLEPIVAGRSSDKLSHISRSTGLENRVVSLDDPAALDRALADIEVVLHLAGPFSRTAEPMVEACLRAGAHYLDVNGEVAVLEGLRRFDSEARSRGVMILPGAAFAVAASDCLAVRVAKRLPSATELRLAYSRFRYGSRGSYRTALEMLNGEVPVCREGRVEAVPAGILEHEFDFGNGPTTCAAMAWGDVATAHRSTGIPNVTTFLEAHSWERAGLACTRTFKSWAPLARPFADAWLGLLPEGPSGAERAAERKIVVAEVQDKRGWIARSRMVTPQVYDVTADVAVLIAQKVLDGNFQPGVRTPAEVFGAGLLSELAGIEVHDLDPDWNEPALESRS